MMSPIRFDTYDVPPPRQFEALRERYRKLFDLNLADGPVSSYPAELTSWDIGGLTLTRASLPPNVVRHWRHWNRPESDDWVLVHAPDATRHPGGGDAPYLSFRSLARSFESYGQDEVVISLFLPRDQFIKQAAIFDRTQPSIPFSGMAALLADYVLSLEHRVRLLSGPELESLAEAVRSMVTACIVPVPDNLEQAKGTIRQTVVTRARKLILQNLHSGDLGPDMLAKHLGMSRSAIYRAFQPHGGIAAIILRERLDEAHRRLAAARRMPHIGNVAFSLGFKDHSAFSRAFKRQFGYAPSDVVGMDP